jgi:transposase
MNHDNAIKYQQFCQFKAEIRGSDHYLIIGIDVAKDKHYAFFGMATGRTLLRRLIFKNNREGFEQLLKRCRQLQQAHSLTKAVFVLESTGNYHKPLAHWLLEQDEQVVLASNKSIADNRQSLDGRWDKNDTKDSANAADLASQGKCQYLEQPEDNIVELRILLSLRKRLNKEAHRLRMQIRNGLVAKYFPEFDRHWGSCLTENLAIVRWCLDPRKIAAMAFNEFVRVVTTRDRGQRQVKRLRSIYEVAGVSIGCPMGDAARFEARQLADRLAAKKEQLDEMMKQIEQVCQRFVSYRHLRTIPGFGPYVAAVVLATIGDPNRFRGRRQLIRLAGLDLNAKRSGKRSQSAVPVISKCGNADLRYALYQAAQIATYHNERFRALFMRYLKGREKERGIKTKVRVKLAAKMLVIAWTMMKNNTDFDPSLLKV